MGPYQIRPQPTWHRANRAPANWASVLYTFVLDIHCQQSVNIYVSQIYILLLDIFCQQSGDICQLEVVSAVCGRRVGECAFSRIYIF